jgi:hypothetical protein
LYQHVLHNCPSPFATHVIGTSASVGVQLFWSSPTWLLMLCNLVVVVGIY